jgi:hypothetical protein
MKNSARTEEKKMEERRVSKGVIRRRASKVEEAEIAVSPATPAISAETEGSAKKVSQEISKAALQIEKAVKPEAVKEPAVEAAARQNTVSKQDLKKQKPAKDNIAAFKKGNEKKEPKRHIAGAGDVLSVVKTLDIDKVKHISEEGPESQASPKKIGKKDEFKKVSPIKFNKNEKFVDTSEESEYFAHRRHKKRFKSNRGVQQISQLQQVIPEKRASKKVSR